MSVEVNIVYEGELHCKATHGPSGRDLFTDAPVDNGGRGDEFSPTDLVATALGTCALTVMALVAQRNGLDLTGARAQIVKEMVSQPVRRIGTIKVAITFPRGLELPAAERAKLERAAAACPVHQSLHPDVKLEMSFV